MLTVGKWAAKNGYNRATVRGWATNGLIEGAIKIPSPMSPVGYAWLIPKDAIAPEPSSTGRKRKKHGMWDVTVEPDVPVEQSPMTREQIYRFVCLHAGKMTYKELSHTLNLSIPHIRRIYEYLHAKYGC